MFRASYGRVDEFEKVVKPTAPQERSCQRNRSGWGCPDESSHFPERLPGSPQNAPDSGHNAARLRSRRAEQSDLVALAADLHVRNPAASVDIYLADLSIRAGIEGCVDYLFTDGAIDVVLIAFGSMPSQTDVDADSALAESLLTLNGVMTLLAAHLTALKMLEKNTGCLVVIGSVAGDRGHGRTICTVQRREWSPSELPDSSTGCRERASTVCSSSRVPPPRR